MAPRALSPPFTPSPSAVGAVITPTGQRGNGEARQSVPVSGARLGFPYPTSGSLATEPPSGSQGNAQRPLGRPEALPPRWLSPPRCPLSLPSPCWRAVMSMSSRGGSLHPPQPALLPLECERLEEHQCFLALGVRVSGRGVPWSQALSPTSSKAALMGFVCFIL